MTSTAPPSRFENLNLEDLDPKYRCSNCRSFNTYIPEIINSTEVYEITIGCWWLVCRSCGSSRMISKEHNNENR